MDTAANRSLCRNPAGLWEAFHTRTILEARAILCTQQHDLVVDFGFCRGIIPRCEGALGIADGSVRDIALLSRVGKPVCFLIESIGQQSDGSLCPVLSRRAAQQLCLEQYIRSLTAGDVIPARGHPSGGFWLLLSMWDAAFPSLIPIDAISVSRISHPRRPVFCRTRNPGGRVRQVDTERACGSKPQRAVGQLGGKCSTVLSREKR